MQTLESRPAVPNYEDYLKDLAKRQLFRVMDLYDKAQEIIYSLGVEDNKSNCVVATMFRGEDRYRIVQEKGKRWSPIYILKGGAEQIQTAIKTDLEECGDPQEAAEVAMLIVNRNDMSGSRIEGQILDIGKKYLVDLPNAVCTLAPILGMWDQLLKSR